MISTQPFINFLQKRALLILLLLGLIVGAVFVFLVPPWMHYDEPGHFEYVWLVANRTGLPEIGDYDQAMRRQLGASLNEVNIRNIWWKQPNLMQFDRPIDIDIPQTSHPPLYYLFASLPLRIFKHTDITFQLYLVRIASLSLFLFLIWITYQTCRELFGEGHPLVWMVPLFLITLPSFVDIMTAANNDAAAIVTFSLFVWASVVIINRGMSLERIAAVIGAVILSVIAKSTAFITVPLGFLVILMATFRNKKYEKYIWLALGVFLIIFGGIIISWNKSAPAFFYNMDNSVILLRTTDTTAPVGDAVITYQCQGEDCSEFYTLLSSEDRGRLAGKAITLGAWVWAEKPTEIQFPEISDGGVTGTINFTSEKIKLSTEPEFFAYSTILSPSPSDINWIIFPQIYNSKIQIFWDGIVLVEGDFSNNAPPEFDDPDAMSGTWEGIPFENVIRNASGEIAWPVFSWLIDYIPPRYALPIARYLSVLDTTATSWYYQSALARLFRSFWGVFGWGEVFLIGKKPFQFFLVLTSLYLIGLIVGLIRRTINFSWHILLFLISASILQIIIVLFRGSGSWFSITYLPVARYFYPAILPLSLLLIAGSAELIGIGNKLLKCPRVILFTVHICFQLGIIVWAINSIKGYYY